MVLDCMCQVSLRVECYAHFFFPSVEKILLNHSIIYLLFIYDKESFDFMFNICGTLFISCYGLVKNDLMVIHYSL